MGSDSGKFPGSGQERFLISDINGCTKVKSGLPFSSLLKKDKTRQQKAKHPTQRPLPRILRSRHSHIHGASRKEAEVAERIYLIGEFDSDAPIADLAYFCN
jgi:hypothetical protein